MSIKAQTGLTTQVFEIYIGASAQSVWVAIKNPEWNAKYGYAAR